MQHRFKDIIAGKKAKKRKLAQSSSKQDDNLIENSATASDPSKNEDPQRSGNPGGGDGTNTISDTDDETDKLTVQDIVQSEPSSKHALVQIFTGEEDVKCEYFYICLCCHIYSINDM